MAALMFTQTSRRTWQWQQGALFAFLCALLLLGGCVVDDGASQQRALLALGEQIFHDARFSADGKVSCASCHDPQRHFTDGKPVSSGVFARQGTRNAPSLLDLAGVADFFWDGRETQLEAVVLQPFTNPQEMGLNDLRHVQRIMQDSDAYAKALSAAFPRGQRAPTPENIGAALAAFLRTLQAPAPEAAPTVAAVAMAGTAPNAPSSVQAGRALFTGKAGCANCHILEQAKSHTSDGAFHHAGIGFEKVAGQVHRANEQLKRYDAQNLPLGLVVLRDGQTAELGRFVKTRKAADIGAFRTPSLRHVAHTAPYMHDGSVPTLAVAIERELYYRGLAQGQPIVLTRQEQEDLLQFLQTL